MTSLKADAVDLGLPSFAAERGDQGTWLHLGRGHLTLRVCKVRRKGVALLSSLLAQPFPALS